MIAECSVLQGVPAALVELDGEEVIETLNHVDLAQELDAALVALNAELADHLAVHPQRLEGVQKVSHQLHRVLRGHSAEVERPFVDFQACLERAYPPRETPPPARPPCLSGRWTCSGGSVYGLL